MWTQSHKTGLIIRQLKKSAVPIVMVDGEQFWVCAERSKYFQLLIQMVNGKNNTI